MLAAAKNTATTEDEYLAIIDAKTAALFSGAARSGGDRLPSGRGASRPHRALRLQSRHRLPARRRRARLLGRQRAARQVGRRRFPRGQDHAARDPFIRRGSWDGARVLEAHDRRRRNRGRRPRARHRPDEAAQGAREDAGAGARAPTGRSRATRWRSSPRAASARRCRTSSRSASAAPTDSVASAEPDRLYPPARPSRGDLARRRERRGAES